MNLHKHFIRTDHLVLMWLCSKNQGFSGILGLVVVLVFELLDFPLLVETTSFAVTFIIICRKLIDHFNDPVWEPLIDDGDYGYMNKENQL